MFNKQLKQNIKAVDEKIGELMTKLVSVSDTEEHEVIMKKIEDLTSIRCRLAESKVAESYSKEIISGLVGVGAMVLVLKYEKADVITTKAFGMLPKLFRGV